MLKSYIPGVDSWIGDKICYKCYFTEKLVNELHNWIQNNTHVILSPNVSYTIYVEQEGKFCQKQNHLLQFLVIDFYNDLILPDVQGGIPDAQDY